MRNGVDACFFLSNLYALLHRKWCVVIENYFSDGGLIDLPAMMIPMRRRKYLILVASLLLTYEARPGPLRWQRGVDSDMLLIFLYRGMKPAIHDQLPRSIIHQEVHVVHFPWAGSNLAHGNLCDHVIGLLFPSPLIQCNTNLQNLELSPLKPRAAFPCH